jgi:hypothetical protein
MNVRTAPLNHLFTDDELAGQCKAIVGGVSWPAKRPGLAVVLAMTPEKHFDSYDIYLLAEYESFDMRELVRQCGVLDEQYKPLAWYGDDRNDAADRLISEMCAELQSQRTKLRPRRCFSVCHTVLVEMKKLYAYILPQLKWLLDPQRRMLFLKDSKIVNYLAAIEENEIADLELGTYPAIEALAFALLELKERYPDARGETHHEEYQHPLSAMA